MNNDSSINSFYSYDEDWGSNAQWLATPGWSQIYDFNIEFLKKRRDYSLEQRVVMNHDLIFWILF